ncbi:hypothetical protein B9Z19DRAFT_989033 [Tuber borchii]|uniref:Uncharacterized protein n=1 Tax=Tuber borchii TaxID=42251 RepID=A0A2T6ZMW8_TUBBO|nr:hypothetical protein B9Z19DRAFT_989033 [Tuber borchii]
MKRNITVWIQGARGSHGNKKEIKWSRITGLEFLAERWISDISRRLWLMGRRRKDSKK